MAPLVSLQQVCAGYAGDDVLHELSLAVHPKEAWAVLGPNGAGKSTLAKVLAGLLGPSRGSVHHHGVEPTAGAALRSKHIAWVPQQTPDDLDFTGLELALMGRAPHLGAMGLTGPADEERARAALDTFDAGAFADRRLSTLSGGERRRVFLARALVQEPRLFVLDEPTAFLDVRHQVETLRRTRALVSSTVAVVAVLHDVSLASHFATHAALLQHGRLVASGSAAEVLTPERLSAVYGIAMERVAEHLFAPRWEP